MTIRRHTRMALFAATMIAVLLLISPVLGGNGGGGGGGNSGGSGAGSGSSSGSSSGPGGETLYSSTVSTGTWTVLGDGWSQCTFQNGQTPVSSISVTTPATGSTSSLDQFPPRYDISVMSDFNTQKLITSVGGTPGSDIISTEGPVIGGQSQAAGSQVYIGLANNLAKDPSYRYSATSFKNQLGLKFTPVVGAGIRYSILPEMLPKLKTNFTSAFPTDTPVRQDAQIIIPSHKITLGVVYKF